MKRIFRDPISGFSHLLGAFLAMGALAFLLYVSITRRNPREIVSFSIFGASMILLYSVSAAYHLVNGSRKLIEVLRKLDHSMIFVLIAGSYTPVCLILLKGAIGYTLISVIWTVALAGIIVKNLMFAKIPRPVYTGIYILMGWLSVLVVVPLYHRTGWIPISWLLAGGLFYTVGGIIYAIKKPVLIPDWFGFHEIFHILILMGSASHFWMFLNYC